MGALGVPVPLGVTSRDYRGWAGLFVPQLAPEPSGRQGGMK